MRFWRSWEAEFPELPAALERVLTRLVRADWRLQWVEQRVFEIEEKLEEDIQAAQWTGRNNIIQLQLFIVITLRQTGNSIAPGTC